MNDISLITSRLTPSLASTGVSKEFVDIRRDGIDWTVLPQLVDELFGDQGLRLAAWLEQGDADIVKDGVHRTVYRLDLPSGAFYLKHYRTPRWRNLAQNLVRPTRAVIERNAAGRVAAQGIPTYDTVAIGRQRWGPIVSDSFLITRSIENVIALDQLADERHDRSTAPLPAPQRQLLAVKLGQLVARLHAGGLAHRDMHAGNVLVRIGRDGEVRLWLIDPTPLSCRSRMSIRAIEANLALLNNSLASMVTPADRCRFFRSYWSTARSLPGKKLPAEFDLHPEPPGDLVRRVEDCCAHALLACHRKNDRKWQTGNRRLIIADMATKRCRAIAGVGKRQVTQIRDEPDSLFVDDRVREWCGTSHSQKVAFIDLDINGEKTTCCAAATAGDVKSLSFIASRIWEGGHALLRRSLKCPKPVLFVEVLAGNHAGSQYIVTQTLPKAVRLCDFLKFVDEQQFADASRQELRRFAETLALRIRSMHALGIDHDALGVGSILIDRSADQMDAAFWQLECITVRRAVSRRQAVTSLARLNRSVSRFRSTTRGLRLRFLRRYLKDGHRIHWKALWREIADATSDVIDRDHSCQVFPYFSDPPETPS